MADAIGIRLDDNTLRKVDLISREESTDRSTIIRKLLNKGINELSKEKAADDYKKGKISLTEAANHAGLTLWDFQHYLIDQGFISSYSIEDIEEELNLLNKKRK